MKNNKLIRLLDPTPRVCPNRQPPRFSPAGSEFLREVVANVSKPSVACTVDGYIVSSSGAITRLFFKREFELLQSGAKELDIANALTNEESVQKTKIVLNSVAKLLDCGVDYLFSPAGYPYSNASELKMLLISVDDIDSGRARRRYVDYHGLAEHIRFYRGRSFSNPKPITVATSAIECFLANEFIESGSADPFPGDLDFILIRDGVARLIGEFKTHNLPSPIDNESCENYQSEDWRRLDVLLKLSSKLNCKLFYIFWGPRHQEIKIQEITPSRKIVQSTVLEKNAKILADFFESNA